MTSTFEVLAEPRRRQIMDLLRGGERPVGHLVDRLALSQPTVSKHLRALREAGLVDVRQDAQRRWYRVRPEPLAEMDAWLAPYRRMWEASLDALERRLDSLPGDDPDTDDADTDDAGGPGDHLGTEDEAALGSGGAAGLANHTDNSVDTDDTDPRKAR